MDKTEDFCDDEEKDGSDKKTIWLDESHFLSEQRVNRTPHNRL